MKNSVITILCVSIVWHWAIHASGAIAARILTLDEALAIALECNPDLAEAQSRVAEAEARLRAARAGGLPILSARGAYDYWTENQRLFPATKNGEQGVFGPQSLGADLLAKWPIYTGGRVSGETEAADWNRQAAAAQLVRMREFLVYQVTAVFYGLLARNEVILSLETAVRAMEEQQRVIEMLVQAGKAARVDLLRANVRRAELYELQVREQNNRNIQQRAWAALLGLDDDSAPDARGNIELGENSVALKSADCMRKALVQRADYHAAQALVSGAEAAIRAARSGRKPTLAAQASYGARWMPDPSDHPDETSDLENLGRVGLLLEFPVFDGYMTSAKVAEQIARRRGAQERLRKLELQIRFDVETALSEVLTARERVQVSKQAIEQADESFRIMKEKYDLGKGTMTDVLEAQTALVVAQTTHARALADLAIADARRKLAIGEILP